MKKLFTLLAVVLLTSASTMAQNGNNGTLKGDVNSDGLVDVADIVAVIDLIQKGQEEGEAGYFYLGTTKPTATNFTTLAGAVTTYTSIDVAVGTKVSVAAGETLYMLCPTSWSKEKSVTLEEGGESINFSNKDAATISGYTIYETQAWKASSTATLKIIPSYYWYCGVASEEPTGFSFELNNETIYIPNIEDNTVIEAPENYNTPGWRIIDTSKTYNRGNPLYAVNNRIGPDPDGALSGQAIYMSGFDENGNRTWAYSVTYYVILPSELNLNLYDGLGNLYTPAIKNVNINNIPYNIYKFKGTEFLLSIY